VPGGLNKISFDGYDNIVMGVNSVYGSIWYADKNIGSNPNWIQIQGQATSISYSNGGVYVIGGSHSSGNIYYKSIRNEPNKAANDWRPISGVLTQISYDGYNGSHGGSSGDVLLENNSLIPNQTIVSANGKYVLVYQTDGNLVMYNVGGGYIWGTQVFGYAPGRLVMQNDGNLVVYDNSNKAVWASNTNNKGTGPYRLIMQNDRNLVIYDAKNQPTWNTRTNI
jgi:hypothetical protein